jgi:nucleoside-diphosphate-sugar epimerase
VVSFSNVAALSSSVADTGAVRRNKAKTRDLMMMVDVNVVAVIESVSLVAFWSKRSEFCARSEFVTRDLKKDRAMSSRNFAFPPFVLIQHFNHYFNSPLPQIMKRATTTTATSISILLPLLGFLVYVCDAWNAVSVVTGGSGFVGREIIHTLLQDLTKMLTSTALQQQQQQQHQPPVIISLVRPSRLAYEQRYWSHQEDAHLCPVKVMPYDMLDGGASLLNAMEVAFQGAAFSNFEKNNDDDDDNNADNGCCCCVYHTASFFGPSDNHVQTALDNVQGTEDVVSTLAEVQEQMRSSSSFSNHCKSLKLILTSSMAAVRGTNQIPHNGHTYTCDDWNTVSQLGDSWGSSYQWSKAQSERRAWELCRAHQVPMVALCPSFIFGPPRDASSSNSYSITLVNEWIQGTSPVQSRLCVDVRDVAKAHVAAALRDNAVGGRFLVSTDARVPSQELAQALRQVVVDLSHDQDAANQITYDAEFTGGAIPIGQPEVLAMERLKNELGITLRPVTETIADMARAMLQMKHQHHHQQQTSAASKSIS